MLRRRFLNWSACVIASVALPLKGFARDQYRVDPRLGHLLGSPLYAFQGAQADFDIGILDKYRPTPGNGRTYYVDPEGGSNRAGGESWRDALQTVTEALAKPDVGTVIVRGDYIYRMDSKGPEGLGVYDGNRDVSIIAEGGRAVFTTARKNAWSDSGTGVFESSSTGGRVTKVLDTSRADEYGEYLDLTEASTLAECKAKEGTWFYAGGRVHLNHGGKPGPEVLLLRASQQGISAKNVRLYMRGLHFVGGGNGAFSDLGASGSVIYAEDCKFTHNWQSDGFKIRDAKLSIAINCVAALNGNDGFNYHMGAETSPQFVEVGCKGFANKADATGNGSTSHDSCVGIRVNCTYHGNAGPGVADVDDARTYNIACASWGNGPSANACGFQASSENRKGEGARMWLDHCSAEKNSGHDIYARAGATIEYRALLIADGDVFADSASSAVAFG